MKSVIRRNENFGRRITSLRKRLVMILSRNGREDFSDPESILLNSEDLKVLFRISSRTLAYWKKMEELPCVQIKGKNHYRLSAVHTLLQQNRFPKVPDMEEPSSATSTE